MSGFGSQLRITSPVWRSRLYRRPEPGQNQSTWLFVVAVADHPGEAFMCVSTIFSLLLNPSHNPPKAVLLQRYNSTSHNPTQAINYLLTFRPTSSNQGHTPPSPHTHTWATVCHNFVILPSQNSFNRTAQTQQYFHNLVAPAFRSLP